jgi:hypothetical protein
MIYPHILDIKNPDIFKNIITYIKYLSRLEGILLRSAKRPITMSICPILESSEVIFYLDVPNLPILP